MKDIVASSCVGLGQLLIGHPFDTAKILIQNKQPWYSLPVSQYYRGWKFPLFYSSLFNVICFTTHERSYKYTQNHFTSGLLGGMAISPFAYVLESFKIKHQVYNKTQHKQTKPKQTKPKQTKPKQTKPKQTKPKQTKPKQNKKHTINKRIMKATFKQIKTTRGLLSLSTRETLAMGVYFQTFHELKKHMDNTLICGGLTGLASWTLTYPIDVIASRQIAQNITIREAFSQRNLWKGIHVCLLRAMIVNAVNFKIYETIMNSKHLSFLDE